MIQRYNLSLPPRQLNQNDILRDIYDLLCLWSFPPYQQNEVVIGVCEAGFRELQALDQSRLVKFFNHFCGPSTRVNIVSHAELRSETKCL